MLILPTIWNIAGMRSRLSSTARRARLASQGGRHVVEATPNTVEISLRSRQAQQHALQMRRCLLAKTPTCGCGFRHWDNGKMREDLYPR